MIKEPKNKALPESERRSVESSERNVIVSEKKKVVIVDDVQDPDHDNQSDEVKLLELNFSPE